MSDIPDEKQLEHKVRINYTTSTAVFLDWYRNARYAFKQDIFDEWGLKKEDDKVEQAEALRLWFIGLNMRFNQKDQNFKTLWGEWLRHTLMWIDWHGVLDYMYNYTEKVEYLKPDNHIHEPRRTGNYFADPEYTNILDFHLSNTPIFEQIFTKWRTLDLVRSEISFEFSKNLAADHQYDVSRVHRDRKDMYLRLVRDLVGTNSRIWKITINFGQVIGHRFDVVKEYSQGKK